jgi:uncharacterized membrane protein
MAKVEKKDNTDMLMHIVYVVGLAFIFIALLVFLVGKNDEGHSGGYIIFHNGFWYVAGMVFFCLVAAACIVWGIRRYNASQETGKLVLPFILAVAFLVLAFGKGCTDKANNYTTSGGQSEIKTFTPLEKFA